MTDIEPTPQVQDGEQSDLSPAQDDSEPTEDIVETTTTQAEDEILLEDSILNTEEDTNTITIVKAEAVNEEETNVNESEADEEIKEILKDASHEAINAIDDTKDNSYDDDEYYYDDDYYYDSD